MAAVTAYAVGQRLIFISLQCGRGAMAAVTSGCAALLSPHGWLQCGRGAMAAVTLHAWYPTRGADRLQCGRGAMAAVTH